MKKNQHPVPVSKPAPLVSFSTATRRQSKLIHGVRIETSTPTTIKKMQVFVFFVSLWQDAGGFHAHQACAFVLEAERSLCLSKAEEDLQYKSAYIH